MFDTYLKSVGVNRSRFIEEMLVKGSELSVGEFETTKSRIISLSAELRDAKHENAKLSSKIARLEGIVKKRPTAEDIEKKKQEEKEREHKKMIGRTMKHMMSDLA